MALPLTLQNRFGFSTYQRKPVVNPFAWRISAAGLAAQCIGVYLPGPDIEHGVLNGAGPVVQVGIGNTRFSIVTTAEGLAANFTGTHRYDSGCALLSSGNANTSREFSIIGRVSLTATPAGNCQFLSLAKAAGDPSGGVSVGANASGQAIAVWTSAGGTTNVTAGSTNRINAGFFTLGGSADASGNGILYENGVRTATGSGAVGSDGAATTPNFMVGYYNGIDSWPGNCAWAFLFNKRLSDAEHWLFANNPWLLIEPINDQLLGSVIAGGGLTLILAQASWAWTGRGAGLNARTDLALGQGSWIWGGAGAGLNSRTGLTLGQGNWAWSGFGIAMNTRTALTLARATWSWAAQGIGGLGSLVVRLRQLMGVGT